MSMGKGMWEEKEGNHLFGRDERWKGGRLYSGQRRSRREGPGEVKGDQPHKWQCSQRTKNSATLTAHAGVVEPTGRAGDFAVRNVRVSQAAACRRLHIGGRWERNGRKRRQEFMWDVFIYRERCSETTLPETTLLYTMAKSPTVNPTVCQPLLRPPQFPL